MIKALGATTLFHTTFTPTEDSLPNVVSADTDTAASAQPFYKDPVTYAVVGGGILAAIGGAMLLKKRRK